MNLRSLVVLVVFTVLSGCSGEESRAGRAFAGLPEPCNRIAEHYDRIMQCTDKLVSGSSPEMAAEMNARVEHDVEVMAGGLRRAGDQAAHQCEVFIEQFRIDETPTAC